MANSPVDRDSEHMQENFGTKYLITDYASEKLLEKNSENLKKFKKFCGGKDGWDDYTERWHE